MKSEKCSTNLFFENCKDLKKINKILNWKIFSVWKWYGVKKLTGENEKSAETERKQFKIEERSPIYSP
jgi:hypothetical protein